MLRYLVFILISCFSIYCFSQNKVDSLVRIPVNDDKNVMLIFESNIIRGIPGHTNYTFEYNTNEKSPFGLVRGNKGDETSLHVITEDNNLYSFVLYYKENIKNREYFIKKSNSVGNVIGQKSDDFNTNNDSLEIEVVGVPQDNIVRDKENIKNVSLDQNDTNIDSLDYGANKNEYYRKMSRWVLFRDTKIRRVYTITEDIVLYLNDIHYNKNELYFELEIQNKSGVDYEVIYTQFMRVSSRPTSNAVSQSPAILPVYTYNAFDKIPANSEKSAIYVFEKFGINKDKEIHVEILEKNGERNLLLSIDYRLINSPL